MGSAERLATGGSRVVFLSKFCRRQFDDFETSVGEIANQSVKLCGIDDGARQRCALIGAADGVFVQVRMKHCVGYAAAQ